MKNIWLLIDIDDVYMSNCAVMRKYFWLKKKIPMVNVILCTRQPKPENEHTVENKIHSETSVQRMNTWTFHASLFMNYHE